MAREQTLRFRCTAELARAVERAATAEGVKPSAWLRGVVEAALQDRDDTQALVVRLDGLLQGLIDAASEAQTVAGHLVKGHIGIAGPPGTVEHQNQAST